MTSSMDVAKSLVNQEEQARLISNRLLPTLTSIDQRMKLFAAVKGVEFRDAHWYTTDELTLSSVVTKGDHDNYDQHDFVHQLGYPSTEGTIMNLGKGSGAGAGNIYIAWSEGDSYKFKDRESKLLPGAFFKWTTDDRYRVYKVYIRTDKADTVYFIEAG